MLESNISEEEIEIKTINHIDKNENSSKSKMILDPPGLSMVQPELQLLQDNKEIQKKLGLSFVSCFIDK